MNVIILGSVCAKFKFSLDYLYRISECSSLPRYVKAFSAGGDFNVELTSEPQLILKLKIHICINKAFAPVLQE